MWCSVTIMVCVTPRNECALEMWHSQKPKHRHMCSGLFATAWASISEFATQNISHERIELGKQAWDALLCTHRDHHTASCRITAIIIKG